MRSRVFSKAGLIVMKDGERLEEAGRKKKGRASKSGSLDVRDVLEVGGSPIHSCGSSTSQLQYCGCKQGSRCSATVPLAVCEFWRRGNIWRLQMPG